MVPNVVILISANIEWHTLLQFFPKVSPRPSPFGSWFETMVAGEPVIFFHGGGGKIAAAASAQYVIERWQPSLIVQLFFFEVFLVSSCAPFFVFGNQNLFIARVEKMVTHVQELI